MRETGRRQWMAGLSILLLAALLGRASYAAKTEDFVNPMKQNIFLVTPKTFESVVGRFRNADGVALLLHFSSNQSRDKKYINDVYNVAANETNGMLQMSAIDCAVWTSFCKNNLNPDLVYPRVVVYPPHPVPPFVAEKTDKASLILSAVRFIPAHNVQVLNETSINGFMSQNPEIPKVLLFSSKSTPPVIYKALSNAFSDRIAFGLVPISETVVAKRYGVSSAPVVLAFRSGSKKPEKYTGAISYRDLHDWTNIRAETFVKGGGFSVTDTKEEMPKPWLSQNIPEMSGPSHQDICFRGSSLCAVLLTNGKITNEQMSMLERLKEEYPDSAERGARFRWMWVDLSIETNFRQLFGLDANTSQLPLFAVINPHKRLRYMLLSADQKADFASIKALIERIISGDGRFVMFKGQKIPSFMPRNQAEKASFRKDEL